MEETKDIMSQFQHQIISELTKKLPSQRLTRKHATRINEMATLMTNDTVARFNFNTSATQELNVHVNV